MQPGFPPAHPPRAADRVLRSWHARLLSDYRCDFWTALGWTFLSCGFYLYYVAYQLARRMRDHNLRRLEMLDGLNATAWERAVASGRDNELRPRFERVGTSLNVMRQMTTDFRDPGIWVVICLLTGGVGLVVLFVLLDGDLVKHSAAEAAAEGELAAILAALGDPVPALPTGFVKQPHQYAGRVAALIASCGIYNYWWLYDVATEGNQHFDRDWAWEDRLVPVALASA